jgi:hypothetical protein
MLKISANLKRHLGDTVPMPEPNDFGRWALQSHHNPRLCCLLGWARVAVGGTPYEPTTAKREAAEELATIIANGNEPTRWNDAKATREEVADRWRETMQALGYKVENKPWKAGKR